MKTKTFKTTAAGRVSCVGPRGCLPGVWIDGGSQRPAAVRRFEVARASLQAGRARANFFEGRLG